MNRFIISLGNISRAVCAWDNAFEDDERLQAFAKRAYERCTVWFGIPIDADRSYKVMQGPFLGCHWNRVLRRYIISLDRSLPDHQSRCATVGHEMCHRVTWHLKGLKRLPWVDEMIACCASQQLLREDGLGYYADQKDYHARHAPHIDKASLYSARRKKVLLGLQGSMYPDGYGATVMCLGAALESLVGWEALCRLVHCNAWNEWADSLPEGPRGLVNRVLEIDELSEYSSKTADLIGPAHDDEIDREIAAHKDLAWAFYQQGRFAQAMGECQHVVNVRPEDKANPRYLAAIATEMGDTTTAISAWKKVIQLRPDYALAHFNLGSIFLQHGDLENAIGEFRQAALLDSKHASSAYNLGVALEKQGRYDEACAEWTKVLALDNPVLEAAARKKLSDCMADHKVIPK